MNDLQLKTDRIGELLRVEKIGGVLLNARHNFAWLTGGGNNAVDTSKENGICHVLIGQDNKRYLLASRIEMPRLLAEEVSDADFEPIEYDWEDEKSNPALVLEIARNIAGETIASDLFYAADCRIIEGLIARRRYELTTTEIEKYRALGSDAGEILGGIGRRIEPGKSEREIAEIVRADFAAKNIETVVNLAAADERIAAFRHPVPTAKVWKKTLMLAVCAKRDGLIASLSRIFSLGVVSDDLRKRTAAVATVHARMIHATRPTANGAEIFAATKKFYAETGFAGEEKKHHQGGACGYKTRDWTAHPTCAETVRADQMFAWNPTITGTKSEETFLVAESKTEIITKSPDFPCILNVVNGIEYSTPNILVL